MMRPVEVGTSTPEPTRLGGLREVDSRTDFLGAQGVRKPAIAGSGRASFVGRTASDQQRVDDSVSRINTSIDKMRSLRDAAKPSTGVAPVSSTAPQTSTVPGAPQPSPVSNGTNESPQTNQPLTMGSMQQLLGVLTGANLGPATDADGNRLTIKQRQQRMLGPQPQAEAPKPGINTVAYMKY